MCEASGPGGPALVPDGDGRGSHLANAGTYRRHLARCRPHPPAACPCAWKRREDGVIAGNRAFYSARGVVLIGDVLEPGHDLTVLVGFLHRDVGHEPVRAGAVPVLLARLDVNDVAGSHLGDVALASADEPDAVG